MKGIENGKKKGLTRKQKLLIAGGIVAAGATIVGCVIAKRAHRSGATVILGPMSKDIVLKSEFGKVTMCWLEESGNDAMYNIIMECMPDNFGDLAWELMDKLPGADPTKPIGLIIGVEKVM